MVNTLAPSRHTHDSNVFDGRYHLQGEIGCGNFSRVFRAVDVTNEQRPVALKLLEQSDDIHVDARAARQTFQREAALLAQLDHKRIPRLYASSLEGEQWYLTLEYICGVTLARYLHRQGEALPLHEVLDIGLQLSEVLSYLHTRQTPIKFRDLNPTNVMRQSDGQLYLIDFGIALPYIAGRLDGDALGTPGYAAPEQYPNERGQGASTLLSDIYGLGAILHQIISREHPQDKVQRKERFRFSPLQGKTDPRMATLIASMLQYRPEQRCQSMQELQERLQAISATASVRAKEYAR